MNKTEKQKYWLAKVSEFNKSGEEKKEWCRKNNISLHQFNYYLKQGSESSSVSCILPKEPSSSENINKQWIPVEIKQDTPINQFLHIKIGVATVEVKPNINKSFLLDVLKTLKAL